MLPATRLGRFQGFTCREPSSRHLATRRAPSATASATSFSPATRCCGTAWAAAAVTAQSGLVGGVSRSLAQLKQSVREKLFVLPRETTILPGHGVFSAIATESLFNPVVGKDAKWRVCCYAVTHGFRFDGEFWHLWFSLMRI